MKKKVWSRILDWVYIIINVTSSLSIIGGLLFDRIPLPLFVSHFVLCFFLYILRWNLNFSFLSQVPRNALLFLFFLIYFFDIIQNIFINPLYALARIIVFFNIFLFLNYLFNLIRRPNDSEGFFTISKPYCAYCVYNVAIVVIAGVLIFMGVLNPESNMISTGSLMEDNLEGGQNIYWPGHLSIAIGNSRLLSAWGIPVTLTGLSHEPHVLNFLILPSLFFIKAYGKFDKWYLVVVMFYVISLFMSFSTTAMGALMAAFFIDFVWRIFVKKKKGFVFVLILSAIVLIWINNRIGFTSLIQDEIVRKTVDQTGSLEYSGSMLKYIVTPSSLFGTGNIPPTNTNLSSLNIGLVSSALDILFYIALIIYTLKLVLSKNESKHFVGVGCAYMLIHLLKVNILAFNYAYLAFIVFILFMLNKRNITRNREISS